MVKKEKKKNLAGKFGKESGGIGRSVSVVLYVRSLVRHSGTLLSGASGTDV